MTITTTEGRESRTSGRHDTRVEHPYRPPRIEQHDVPWRDFQPITKFAAILAIAAGVWYLAFLYDRAHENHPLLWILTLIAESIVVIHTLGIYFTLVSYRSDLPEPENVGVTRRGLLTGEIATPSVDVFICHATEPLHLVLPTIIAAQEMLLPHNTWVLDDGRDPQLREACEKLGVGYLRRTSNAHAKAGNVNSAFQRTNGEYVLILDADHVPRPDFLVQTLPHLMVNPSVALVQTPQTYDYEGRGMVAEGAAVSQELFYEAIMPAKNQSNSAFCVGTNVIMRRRALETLTTREKTWRERRRDAKLAERGGEIEPALTELGHEFPRGGIWIGSNSEDIWTALQLHRRGWRTVFLPKVLSQGLTPDTISAFLKQQFRWASGGWEILLWAHVIRDHRLTLSQKMQYMLVCTHYMLSFATAIFAFLSPIYLLTDRSPVQSPFWNWAVHFVPFYMLTLAVPFIQAGKFRWSAVAVSLTAAPAHIKGFYSTLFRQKSAWSVTNSRQGGFSLRLLLPHLLVGLLNVLAIVVGVLLRGQDITAFIIAMFFTLLTLYTLVFVLVKSEKADRLARAAADAEPDANTSLSMLDEYIGLRASGAFR